MRRGAQFGLFLLALAFVLQGIGVSAQAPPSLPSSVHRFAWFSCDPMSVNGNVKVYGVPAVNGAKGFGGHIASNGDIQVSGNNTVAGNATPGPGRHVAFDGGTGQVQGSTAPAAAALPCEEQDVAEWASYAQANNNNSVIPSKFIDAQRNVTINGVLDVQEKFTHSGLRWGFLAKGIIPAPFGRMWLGLGP